jgi:large subunit ribosomal protein L24e
MVEKRNCSFCGDAIEPGTGKMYIKKDGSVFNFCTNKCKKNNIDLGRVSRRTKWTVRYGELKASALSRTKGTSEDTEEAPVEKPVKKSVANVQAKPVKKAESTDTKPAKKAPAKPKKEAAPKDK